MCNTKKSIISLINNMIKMKIDLHIENEEQLPYMRGNYFKHSPDIFKLIVKISTQRKLIKIYSNGFVII